MTKQLFLIILVITASAIYTAAQGEAPPGASDTDLRNRADPNRMRSAELERVKRNASSQKKPAGETDNTVPKFAEIKEDFEELQKLNNDQLQPAGQRTPLDHEAIFQSAIEIKRRSTRLKSNLFASDPQKSSKKKSKEKTKHKAEPQDLKTLLIQLDNALMRFVSSPIFQSAPIVDAEVSVKAQNDLEEVTRLSSLIADRHSRGKTTSQK